MISSTAFLAGIMGLGAPELIIVLVILLVLFGGAKLPSLAKGLGQSIKEFKKASKEEDAAAAAPAPAPAAAPVPEPTKKLEAPAAARTHGAN